MKVAYCNVEDLNLSDVYRKLPLARKHKVDNFRFVRDKKLSAGAYLLLDKMLKDAGVRKPVFEFGEYQKAYISNYDDIYFNLSHSGNMVACAVSDKEVGVDVEFIDTTIDLNIAKNFFYNSEYESIMNSPKASDEFFRYWVLKESYMKYTGLGFNLNLDEFEIIIEDEIKLKNDTSDLKFTLFDLEKYKLAVCGKYRAKTIENEIIEYDGKTYF